MILINTAPISTHGSTAALPYLYPWHKICQIMFNNKTFIVMVVTGRAILTVSIPVNIFQDQSRQQSTYMVLTV